MIDGGSTAQANPRVVAFGCGYDDRFGQFERDCVGLTEVERDQDGFATDQTWTHGDASFINHTTQDNGCNQKNPKRRVPKADVRIGPDLREKEERSRAKENGSDDVGRR